MPVRLGEAIAKTIIADMKGEKLPQIKGYSYSRYKNTSDVTWRIAMNKALEKARATQTPEENGQLTLKFD